MKKFLVSFAVAAICSSISNAQEAVTNSSAPTSQGNVKSSVQKQDNQRIMQRRQENMKDRNEMEKARGDRWKNASPEEKARMEKRHEIMKKLSNEQRDAVKNEMERHRQEIKRITGSDELASPMPPMNAR